MFLPLSHFLRRSLYILRPWSAVSTVQMIQFRNSQNHPFSKIWSPMLHPLLNKLYTWEIHSFQNKCQRLRSNKMKQHKRKLQLNTSHSLTYLQCLTLIPSYLERTQSTAYQRYLCLREASHRNHRSFLAMAPMTAPSSLVKFTELQKPPIHPTTETHFKRRSSSKFARKPARPWSSSREKPEIHTRKSPKLEEVHQRRSPSPKSLMINSWRWSRIKWRRKSRKRWRKWTFGTGNTIIDWWPNNIIYSFYIQHLIFLVFI